MINSSLHEKNASRHCKIRATSLLSYSMNTVSLAAHIQSTIITTTVWLGLQLVDMDC